MTTPYATGTVSVTAGSAIVTGVGTGWQTAGLIAGVFGLDSANGNPIPVKSVDSDTQITLAKPWRGQDANGQAYWITYDTTPGQQTVTVIEKVVEYIARLNKPFFAALTNLVPAANTLPYFGAGGVGALTSLSAFMRTVLDDANGEAVYATLGAVPNAQLPARREVLTADRNYYVRPDGNDGNNGLANTSGGAFLTISRALQAAYSLDLGVYNVNINLADGTYTQQVNPSAPFTGKGTVTIIGNTGSPQNVKWQVNNARCISASGGAKLAVSGIQFSNLGSGELIVSEDAGTRITIGAACQFGQCVGNHLFAYSQGQIFCRSSYSIVAGAYAHAQATLLAAVDIQGVTVTLVGTPKFTGAFALGYFSAVVRLGANTFSGSATGSRYNADGNAGIDTSGAGQTYLPGDSAGAVSGGAYYR